nr:unnamed protein product [Naegleria fowleri]
MHPYEGYAKLCGQDIEFYIQKLSVTLGRTRVPDPSIIEPKTFTEEGMESETSSRLITANTVSGSNSTTGSSLPPSIETLQRVLWEQDVDIPLGTNKNISRLHAKIVFNTFSKQFELHVLSKNGAKVNGVFYPPIPHSQPIPLHNGYEIQLGDCFLTFMLPLKKIVRSDMMNMLHIKNRMEMAQHTPQAGDNTSNNNTLDAEGDTTSNSGNTNHNNNTEVTHHDTRQSDSFMQDEMTAAISKHYLKDIEAIEDADGEYGSFFLNDGRKNVFFRNLGNGLAGGGTPLTSEQASTLARSLTSSIGPSLTAAVTQTLSGIYLENSTDLVKNFLMQSNPPSPTLTNMVLDYLYNNGDSDLNESPEAVSMLARIMMDMDVNVNHYLGSTMNGMESQAKSTKSILHLVLNAALATEQQELASLLYKAKQENDAIVRDGVVTFFANFHARNTIDSEYSDYLSTTMEDDVQLEDEMTDEENVHMTTAAVTTATAKNGTISAPSTHPKKKKSKSSKSKNTSQNDLTASQPTTQNFQNSQTQITDSLDDFNELLDELVDTTPMLAPSQSNILASNNNMNTSASIEKNPIIQPINSQSQGNNLNTTTAAVVHTETAVTATTSEPPTEPIAATTTEKKKKKKPSKDTIKEDGKKEAIKKKKEKSTDHSTEKEEKHSEKKEDKKEEKKKKKKSAAEPTSNKTEEFQTSSGGTATVTQPQIPSAIQQPSSSLLSALAAIPSLPAGPITNKKPDIPYSAMIAHALLKAPNYMLPLKSIYAWISDNYPFYDPSETGWKSSVRHNLSTNSKYFRRVSPEEWRAINGEEKKPTQQRKVGKEKKMSFSVYTLILDHAEEVLGWNDKQPKKQRESKKASSSTDVSSSAVTTNATSLTPPITSNVTATTTSTSTPTVLTSPSVTFPNVSSTTASGAALMTSSSPPSESAQPPPSKKKKSSSSCKKRSRKKEKESETKEETSSSQVIASTSTIDADNLLDFDEIGPSKDFLPPEPEKKKKKTSTPKVGDSLSNAGSSSSATTFQNIQQPNQQAALNGVGGMIVAQQQPPLQQQQPQLSQTPTILSQPSHGIPVTSQTFGLVQSQHAASSSPSVNAGMPRTTTSNLLEMISSHHQMNKTVTNTSATSNIGSNLSSSMGMISLGGNIDPSFLLQQNIQSTMGSGSMQPSQPSFLQILMNDEVLNGGVNSNTSQPQQQSQQQPQTSMSHQQQQQQQQQPQSSLVSQMQRNTLMSQHPLGVQNNVMSAGHVGGVNTMGGSNLMMVNMGAQMEQKSSLMQQSSPQQQTPPLTQGSLPQSNSQDMEQLISLLNLVQQQQSLKAQNPLSSATGLTTQRTLLNSGFLNNDLASTNLQASLLRKWNQPSTTSSMTSPQTPQSARVGMPQNMMGSNVMTPSPQGISSGNVQPQQQQISPLGAFTHHQNPQQNQQISFNQMSFLPFNSNSPTLLNFDPTSLLQPHNPPSNQK